MEKAAARPDLSADERRYLARALAIRRWQLVEAELAEGVATEDRETRGAAFAFAWRRGISMRVRAKAAAYALSPRLTTRALRRRHAIRDGER